MHSEKGAKSKNDDEMALPSICDTNEKLKAVKSEEEESNQPAVSEPNSPVETQPPLRRSKRTCVRKFVV